MASTRRAVAASAPGKVLLAGGYLVLDRDYTGLVFGLDARIHVVVQPVPTSSGVTLSEITVTSPQFKDAVWEYGYRLTEKNGGIKVTQLRALSTETLHRNPFVETALSYALTYISALTSEVIKPASIVILADNDYYSQTDAAPTEVSAPGETRRFAEFNVPIWDAHKTGLGSSAALVTAFTAAVLSYYLPETVFSLSSEKSKERLHNLAQAAHCAAQGKVGSGFDVAAAVYGSCIYRRFSPELLQFHAEPGEPGFGKQLQYIVESGQWDTEINRSKVKVPEDLRLIMCDVDCGSKTPGMVKQVLAWRKDKPEEAEELWKELQTQNDALAADLLAQTEKVERDHAILKSRIEVIRGLIRKMSDLSGVPIEPPVQTKLIDACSDLPGVVGGVVPGAGGFDAFALLVEEKSDAIAQLKGLLDKWENAAPDDKGPAIGRVSILDVRGEMEGVRKENEVEYSK